MGVPAQNMAETCQDDDGVMSTTILGLASALESWRFLAASDKACSGSYSTTTVGLQAGEPDFDMGSVVFRIIDLKIPATLGTRFIQK